MRETNRVTMEVRRHRREYRKILSLLLFPPRCKKWKGAEGRRETRGREIEVRKREIISNKEKKQENITRKLQSYQMY